LALAGDVRNSYNDPVSKKGWIVALAISGVFPLHAQIDPEPRRLIQIGYNQPLEGQGPIAGYGFFYYNKPNFFQTNLTLRAAIAPIYLDSELGWSHLLGDNTDMAFGLAGGGFADSYSEIRQGSLKKGESFTGDGGEVSVSVFHLFNPGWRVPLYGVARASYHHSIFDTDSDTARDFELPNDLNSVKFRTGLRLGGREPTLDTPLAMEISLWYETFVRLNPDRYGFNNDREVRENSHLFWARSLLKYTFPKSEQYFDLNITGGFSANADRFSAYRLGGVLPFVSEFPLSIPGYYYQELTAKRFGLVNGEYSFPIAPNKHWRASFFAAGGLVDYLDGFEQAQTWHSGVGAGVTYVSASHAWFVTLVGGHGFNAIRHGEAGANNVGVLFQYDFDASKKYKLRRFEPEVSPYQSKGGERLFK
jgi:hypothetical protein